MTITLGTKLFADPTKAFIYFAPFDVETGPLAKDTVDGFCQQGSTPAVANARACFAFITRTAGACDLDLYRENNLDRFLAIPLHNALDQPFLSTLAELELGVLGREAANEMTDGTGNTMSELNIVDLYLLTGTGTGGCAEKDGLPATSCVTPASGTSGPGAADGIYIPSNQPKALGYYPWEIPCQSPALVPCICYQ